MAAQNRWVGDGKKREKIYGTRMKSYDNLWKCKPMENLWDNIFFPLKHGKIRNPWNEWENLEEPMETLIFEWTMTILFELGDGTIYRLHPYVLRDFKGTHPAFA